MTDPSWDFMDVAAEGRLLGGRMNGGTVRGDAAAADRFRSMIVPL